MGIQVLTETNWFVTGELPDTHMKYLWERIDAANEENINVKKTLAGVISRSLAMKDPENFIIEKVFKNISQSDDVYPYIMQDIQSRMRVILQNEPQHLTPYLDAFWVNYQYKHEYNPMHRHDGMYSFVIWMDIPYSFDDEKKTSQAKDSGSTASVGNFSFMHFDGNEIKEAIIEMRPDMNGKLVVFPSYLKHMVYPFYTSDKPRVSISGNIYMK